MKLHLLFILLLQVSFISYSQTTQQKATQKIEELNLLITQAESSGIDATKEKMGIRIANIFLVCADWDEDNKSVNVAEFTAHNSIPNTVTPRLTPIQLADRIPEYQREEVVRILDEGINKLTKLINGTETRKPTPTIQWDQLNIEGARITQNGVPIFLNDWNFKEKKEIAGYSTTEYFGDLDGYFFDARQVQRASDGSLVANPGLINFLNNNLESGNFGAPFLGQSLLPDFIKTDYPDITNGHSEFTAFDIDHPVARTMHEALFKGFVPVLKDKNSSKLGYMLSNEPHWNTAGTWDIVDITPYTKAKFVDWLKDKHGNLATLNAVWNSAFGSFEDATNSIQTPIPSNLRGTPKWFDFMRFNQNRVTNWFLFLNDEIKKYDPEAKTHIKLINEQWSGNARDNGLDFEALTSLTDIHGNDAAMRNSVLWGRMDWQDSYTMEWLGAMMTYDFMNSVNPNATNYNSEAHFLTHVRFTDSFLVPSYARASHWLATLHGLDATTNWVWLRDEDGSYKRENFIHAGTIAQQPGILNEIHSTIMDLNSYGEEISLLQEMETPIRIFYSETSAINKENHMEQVSNLYESLYFEGYRLGFATEKIIKNQDNTSWETILVLNTEFVTLNELNALQLYLDNGGTIITDAISLKKDEYGNNHSLTLSPSAGTIINANSNQIKTQAIDLVTSKGHLLKISVTEQNTVSNEFKGVVHRSTQTTEGKNVISLVNLGLTNATITLGLDASTDGLEIKNLLTGVLLTNGFEIASEQVLFLEVSKKSTLNIDDVTNPLNNAVKVYPNPFSSEFFVSVTTPQKLKYEVYDITGKILREGTLNKDNTDKPFIFKNLTNGIYFFSVSTNNNKSKKVFKLCKN